MTIEQNNIVCKVVLIHLIKSSSKPKRERTKNKVNALFHKARFFFLLGIDIDNDNESIHHQSQSFSNTRLQSIAIPRCQQAHQDHPGNQSHTRITEQKQPFELCPRLLCKAPVQNEPLYELLKPMILLQDKQNVGLHAGWSNLDSPWWERHLPH